MKTLGMQIKERRKALKITQKELADLAGISINTATTVLILITQKELADLAGISINTVVAAERGQGDPKISTYLAICNVLGLKLIVQL